MDAPLWVVLAVLAVAWLLAIVIYAVFEVLFPALRGNGVFIGGALAALFVIVAFWIALGERSLRLQRLRAASSRYRLGALSAIEFEEAVGELFRLQGYGVVENKRPDREDGGVDIEISAEGETLLVQVKHKWEEVGVRELRELWGLVASEGVAGAVFVTSSRFTERALEFSEGKRLELIDAENFLRLRKRFLAPNAPTPEHDPVVSDGFARHVAAMRSPACPRCGKTMFLITSLTGTEVTRQFWGCSDYPACQSSRRASPYLGEELGDAYRSAGPQARLTVALSNRLSGRKSGPK